MDDEVVLTYKKKKRQGRVRCIAGIVALIVAFFIGFLIGFLAMKSKSEDEKKKSEMQDEEHEFQRRQEEAKKYHLDFQKGVSEARLNSSLMYFSEKPHIAGSPRQKELANELERRWKEYGFDHVEQPEYKALLSFPNTTHPTRITIKYKNGTIIHQIKGEEQDGGSEKAVQPFLGYSPSGKEEGELVYVNYGRVRDFEQLKNLSVNVTGKIAIMRYGKIIRGNKVANAASYGAIAALIFSDPADYALAGGDPKNTYPNTAWLPASGVQRGSLYTFPGSGDPQTPGIAAKPGMYRRSLKESELPPIPAHPIGYGDAIEFLSRMKGPEAPKDWRGSLDITYRLGPGYNDNDMTVSLEINNYYEVKSIFNVIGTIYGDIEPDRYVLIGSHRDSWVNGAVDSVSGIAITTEIARGFGELKKAGWKPRRTIKICSWGGEEYSLIGSVEWVEQHEKLLTERAVIYLNADAVISGNYLFAMSSSPLVKNTLLEFTKMVDDPGAHGDKKTLYDVMAERDPADPRADPPKPKVGNLGSGSDFAPFYQYIGVPAADFRYRGYNNTPVFYPVYHTQHDTFKWLTKFIDPDFKYHKALTQFCGQLLLAFADTPLLRMNAMLYAEALEESLKSLNSSYGDELKSHSTLGLLESAVVKFRETADHFTKAQNEMEKKIREFEEPSFAELRRFNDRLIKVERAFIYAYGLPGRRLVRHVIFAPSKYNLYGSSSFPGASDILFKLHETGDTNAVDLQLSIATQSVLAAVDILKGTY
ncbi:putative N-acetylated-alpha-linked acidic dipeptidase [Montipora capricornis]|uniref:putative N-acetylated-alpha-linked acidic dipeptidase n=1 Tax=Montipora capricornis TaxID=246305 RepID=UPI0035F172E9